MQPSRGASAPRTSIDLSTLPTGKTYLTKPDTKFVSSILDSKGIVAKTGDDILLYSIDGVQFDALKYSDDALEELVKGQKDFAILRVKRVGHAGKNYKFLNAVGEYQPQIAKAEGKNFAAAGKEGVGGEVSTGISFKNKYSELDIQRILSDIRGRGFKDNPLRQAYENEVKDLYILRDDLFQRGVPKNDVAQTLYQARRDLGVKYKNATPQPLRDYIYQVNIDRYGDPLGPSFEKMIESGKTYDDIINSALRPNSDIDRLLSGFENWLRRQ